MRGFVVTLTLLVAAAAANPRERRQTDECFWWEEDCNTQGGGGPTPVDPAPKDPPTGGSRNNEQTDWGSYQPCSTGRGHCVPYYLCRDGHIITDGSGLIDIRFGNANSSQSSSDCPQYLDVCCTLLNPDPVTPEPTYDPKCGRRNPQGVNARILGFKDNQAQFGEFPWMAALLREENVGDKAVNLYVCGGSLIHPSVVLTAAHCVGSHKAEVLKVRLGEWDTQRTYELYSHQDRRVIKTVVHGDYRSGPLHNDFALLILDKPAVLEPHVDTVCLPENPVEDFTQSECWATGWGKDKFGKEGVFQNVLKKIELNTWYNSDCQNSLRTTRLGKNFILDRSFVCAGGKPGLDTCKGDGGSPLVCKLPNNQYVQAGIVAWGIGCGEKGIPGVYANVPYALDWIKSTAEYELQLIGQGASGYWEPYI